MLVFENNNVEIIKVLFKHKGLYIVRNVEALVSDKVIIDIFNGNVIDIILTVIKYSQYSSQLDKISKAIGIDNHNFQKGSSDILSKIRWTEVKNASFSKKFDYVNTESCKTIAKAIAERKEALEENKLSESNPIINKNFYGNL